MIGKRSLDEEKGLDSDTLLKKLRVLDPAISPLDYWLPDHKATDGDGGRWDHAALAEDVWLTSRYVTGGLEGVLRPLRAEMQKLLAPAATSLCPSVSNATEVIPGKLVLGNAAAARDVKLLKRLNIRRVLNVSPQTVHTSINAYAQLAEGQVQAYHECWADDLPDYCIMDHFNEAWDFVSPSSGSRATAAINGGRKDDADAAPGACLIHCEQGVNRSGALVCAIHLRLVQEDLDGQFAVPSGPHLKARPEEAFWNSWKFLCLQRGDGRGVVTNPSFQRQLLLFARLGCRWWLDMPSVSLLWQTPEERSQSAFRRFCEKVAERSVRDWPAPGINVAFHKLLATLVRDGAMRGESKLPVGQAFDLESSTGAAERAERRVMSYATKLLSKKVLEVGEPRQSDLRQ